MTDVAVALKTSGDKPARGRPRDESKNQAILDAAVTLFLRNGYDATSMDEVAKLAGVSKQTVYSHFEGKEGLFAAAIRYKIDEYSVQDALDELDSHTLEADLVAVASTVARLLLSPEAVAMVRLLAAGGGTPQGKELSQRFWDAGPEVMLEEFKAFLDTWVQSGELTIPDLDAAASQLIALLKGGIHLRLAIGLDEGLSEQQFAKHVLTCVDMFLTRYRTRPGLSDQSVVEL